MRRESALSDRRRDREGGGEALNSGLHLLFVALLSIDITHLLPGLLLALLLGSDQWPQSLCLKRFCLMPLNLCLMPYASSKLSPVASSSFLRRFCSSALPNVSSHREHIQYSNESRHFSLYVFCLMPSTSPSMTHAVCRMPYASSQMASHSQHIQY